MSWHFIDDDSAASDADAERWPDAVYDDEDPDWDFIHGDDGPDVADYDDSWGSPDDWGWDDWPDDFDGEFYEVEIGIDYGEDT